MGRLLRHDGWLINLAGYAVIPTQSVTVWDKLYHTYGNSMLNCYSNNIRNSNDMSIPVHEIPLFVTPICVFHGTGQRANYNIS